MDRVIRYRPEWRQLPWLTLGALLPLTVSAAGGRLVVAFVVFATLHVAAFAWVRTTGVELRPDALVARGLRVRTLPWQDITSIAREALLGGRYVRVRTRDTSFRLRAPLHWWLTPDPDFEAKAGMIYDYWLRNRGTDWRLPSDPWRPPPDGEIPAT